MIKKAFRILILYLLAPALAVMPVSFVQLGLRADILPDLALCVVYFLALYTEAGVMQMFFYGLFASELHGYPLGIESLLFVTAYAMCSKYKTALLSKEPLSLYAGFAAVAILYNLGKFVLLSLYYGHLFDYASVMMQAVTTVLFYPAIDFVMRKVLA